MGEGGKVPCARTLLNADVWSMIGDMASAAHPNPDTVVTMDADEYERQLAEGI